MLVDVGVRQVDRPFDYLVPAQLDAQAVVGARVRVRFAGRLVNGFILARSEATEHEGELREVERVLGPAVLTDEIATLTHEVAQAYVGTWSDVVRSAVPPRHVEAEKLVGSLPTATGTYEPAALEESSAAALGCYVGGQQLFERLASNSSDPTRVALTVSPSVDGEQLLAGITSALPGKTLILAPDSRSVGRLRSAFRTLAAASTRVEVLDSADSPRARYTAFLKVLRSEVDIAIGTRDAVFAPLAQLDRIVVWDEGSEHFRDQRAPRWNARRVAMMRARRTGCDLVLAGYSRSLETAQLVESGWLTSIALPQDQLRSGIAKVVTEADARGDDVPGARIAGIAWRAIKSAIEVGPVLVSVPRAGYVRFLACSDCELALECANCGGVLELTSPKANPSCAVCAQVAEVEACPECESIKLKMLSVGASRIVEELKRAFPRTTILESSAKEGVLTRVSSEPQIVVATTGSEPVADGRFQASIVLDGRFSLMRTDLNAGESALYRWMHLAAGTKSAEVGGQLVVTGNQTNRIVQSVLRMDPNRWAQRELQERADLRLPPMNRFVELSAPIDELEAFTKFAKPYLEVIADLRIVQTLPREEMAVTLLTAPIRQSRALISTLNQLVHAWFGVLSDAVDGERPKVLPPTPHKSHQLRVEVDPARL